MSATRKYSYEHVPTCRAFANDDSFIRGLMGPLGSGKSVACVMEVLRRAQMMAPDSSGRRRCSCAVIRNTYPQLRDTTIRTFHEWVPPSIFGQYKVAEHNYIITGLADDIELEVMFRALDRPDQVQNLLSAEYTFAWINEARDVPREIVDGLTGRVGRFPPPREVPDYWSGIWMDTNPPDTDSWWYKAFEEEKYPGWKLFKQPSGRSENPENLGNLRADYYQRLMSGKSKEWIKIYVDGQYGFGEAGRPVYPEYQDWLHVSDEPLIPSPAYPIVVGVDFGLTPAAVFAQITDTRVEIFDELVCEDDSAVNFGPKLKKKMQGYGGFEFEIWGDPGGEQRAQTDKRTPIKILRAMGIPIHPARTPGANDNDFTIRRDTFARRLQNLALDGKPQMLLDSKLTKLRKGLAGGYKFTRVISSNGASWRDVPAKGPLSHVCEAAQYALIGAGEGMEIVKMEEAPQPKVEYDFPTLGSLGWMGS